MKQNAFINIAAYRATGVDIWVEERGHKLDLKCGFNKFANIHFNFLIHSTLHRTANSNEKNLGWGGGEIVLEDDLALKMYAVKD